MSWRFKEIYLAEYRSYIIKTYGFTKDPELEDYILVMEYASGGDLHKHLQKNFASITWNNEKLHILHQISVGLKTIHNKEFIHRDFHSGNILLDPEVKIGDLGLSQAVNSKSSNNEIYGVIPYIAPEIFIGSRFSKEADIYSLGMIMWELTTGCKPFDNVKHDHHLIYKILDGERPKITEDTPKCYAELMKSCWDPDPKKRASIKDIELTFRRWKYREVSKKVFSQAEAKREKLIESKKIGPEFAEKRHLGAIYTSRPLSALISKCSSIYSFSTISFDSNYISKLENNADIESLSLQNLNSNYISEELELDIDIESLLSQNLNSAIQKFPTALDSRYSSAELELDINTKRSQNLNSTIQNYSTAFDPRYISAKLDLDINTESSTIQNYSTSLKKRRYEEFLNVKSYDNNGKRIKTSFNYL